MVKRVRVFVLTVLFFLLSYSFAMAAGEIFKVATTKGREYYSDFHSQKLNKNNSVPLYVFIISDFQMRVSPYPTFDLYYDVVGYGYHITPTKKIFVGGFFSDAGPFMTVECTIQYFKTGDIKRIKGTFVQSETAYPEVFSTGKFKTVQRLH